MKKIIFICEGQTEQMFCDKILKPHFNSLGIIIEYPLIIHSNGGIVKWNHLKLQIENHYASDNVAIITTFIDYYGIEDYHNFPDWNLAKRESDIGKTINFVQASMKKSILGNAKNQFVPYIQLHEFEALLLCDYRAFVEYYIPSEYNAAGLHTLCSLNPEEVNNGLTTAPSKRIIQNIPGFDKVNAGPDICSLIGLTIIRGKCPRFNMWLSALGAI